MTQTSIAFQMATGAQPIPGYVLEGRIGTGGYGEVWKAKAPGGLTKAIKFIYGHLEEERATRELKSLNRIRELNHPFLLTLERIEVIDGHLVIVTELADLNLKERFGQCCAAGMPGIPREELLVYLNEAADALDYLSDSHSFQHLDVKPENLLLVAKHIKIADFGLLKDLRDVSVSFVNGLTPRYASPEVFNGRPGHQSDQYSLAIVYQEMATGQFPFDGRTAATLAAQHLHSDPNLSALTPHERFAVGKALSKDPSRRFGSCREFVARLTHQSNTTIIGGRSGKPAGEGRRPRAAGGDSVNRSFALPAANDSRLPSDHDGQTIVVSRPETVSLPALELDGQTPAYRPTVFIGIGGTGERVLRRLRQMISDGFADVATCPALQFLLIDTDITAISKAVSRTTAGALREHETLMLPLRRPWDYRAREIGNVTSISRRWLYNVPRSLRTEGMRALGRLALLDHSKRVLERLRMSILAAVDGEAVSSTAENTGLPFQESDPRIFLVASIAGGTGGGMLLDVAYAVRQILAETGLSDEEVCGMLAYSTAREESTRNLAPANAYAFLEELQHFSLPENDYPGEPACRLAGFREDGPAFRSTYLIDMGDNLTEERFTRAVDRLARYLFASSVSPAALFFDTCRKPERSRRENSLEFLRTAALAPLGADNAAITPRWIELLCNSVVRSWRGGIDTAGEEERVKLSDYKRALEMSDSRMPSDEFIESSAAELQLDIDRLGAHLKEAISEDLGQDVGTYLKQIASESFHKALTDGGDMESAVTSAFQTIHAVVGVNDGSRPELSDRMQTLSELCDSQAHRLGRAKGEALKAWILGLVDNCDARVAGARRVVERIDRSLETIETDGREQARSANAERTACRQELVGLVGDTKRSGRTTPTSLAGGLREYVKALLKELIADGACKTVNAIRPFVTACSDQLRDFWKDLNRLSEEFKASPGADDEATTPSEETGPAASLIVPLEEVFADNRKEMIEHLDREVEQGFFTADRRLNHVLTQGSGLRTSFIAYMRSAARKVILHHVTIATLSRLSEALGEDGAAGLATPLDQCLQAVTPNLLRFAGGAKRLVLITPAGADAGRLKVEVERLSGEEVTLISGTGREVLLCCEVEQLGEEAAGARFLRSQPDCQELASRLHTRTDIRW